MEHARVCADIDMGAVSSNFEAMHRKLKSGVKMIAVIKTNGYGHGAVPIARMTESFDYIWGFAVATIEEAMELRDAGISKPVLILGYVFPDDFDAAVRGSVRPAVFTLAMAEAFNDAARRAGVTAPVHLAVDTGMTRIGLPVTEEGADEAQKIAALDHLKIEGMFTHFAKADETDKTFAYRQFERYEKFSSMLRSRGVDTGMRHVCNSAGIMELPDFQLDAVRAGITIYGIYPSDEVNRDLLKLRPAMSLISHIAMIKTVPAGTAISYGGTFVTEKESVIATIPVGYGDGYPRLLSNCGSVLIKGKRAPITGRVCMDQFMVDVTGLDVHEHDRVTLMGRDGEDEITADEIGHLCGRFPYELVCDITSRVPRVHQVSFRRSQRQERELCLRGC